MSEGQILFGVEVVTEVTERQESRLAMRALRLHALRPKPKDFSRSYFPTN